MIDRPANRQREILVNAQKVWEVFYEDSVVEGDRRSWVGIMSEARERAELSVGQFAKVIKFLKDADCILVVGYGNRYSPSVLRLDRPPDSEIFSDFLLTGARPPGKLEQRINDVTRLIGGLNLAERLDNIEQRLSKLENHIRNEGEEK